ncbi:MAG TPA: DEAD/DEAH box helicase [Lachnospiraceae bacterium]|nr:DEAD/DEAH box helicase [Lachnospiraceae bacterium]
MEILRYEDSDIDPKILRAVAEMGFEQMTPIQAQAIPILLEGRDVIGQAQTGTGKTAAFGIPIIQRIDPENRRLQAIILCPTRELAIQAAEEMRHFAKFLPGVKILPIYGGQDITKQIRSLKSDVQIVVGTPGRVMDHMRRHTMKLDDIKTVVLDEADEMLNMGFKEDIETILQDIPADHQMALFSATMPKAILDITKNYQRNAVLVKVTHKELTIPLVKQYYYEVKGKNKEEVVSRLLDYYNPKLTLIFANTKRMVDELSENLKGRGYFAEGLHGDMSQNQRDMVMNRFRSGNVEILIATDVAARGIDVEDVEAVFNYDIPQDIEYYVHRIGRTGRAGRKGRAFTLVVGREIYKIREIENICKTKVKARSIPSAADITAVKAQKILTQVMDILRDSDLSAMTKLIEQKMNDDDCTAMEMAAAFLKLHMGEAIQDIPVEEYTPRKTYGAYGQTRGGDGRGRSGGRSSSGGQRRDGRGSREGGYSRDSRTSKEGSYSSDRKPYARDSKPSFHREGERTPYARDSKPAYKDGERSSYSRDSKPSFHKDGEKTIYPRDSKPAYKDGEKSSKKKSIVKDSGYFKGKKPKSKESAPQD